MIRVVLSVLTLTLGCAGHGMITYPPSRQQSSMATAGLCLGIEPSIVPQNGTCLWFNQGCQIGCPACSGANCVTGNCCPSPMAPTLTDPHLRTYQNVFGYDWSRKNPWRAPGYAPIIDPCGLAGGFDSHGAAGNGGFPPQGVKQGASGSKLPPVPHKMQWKAGATAEVAWSIFANHGGGYAYRLCPASQTLTEACFQLHPLEFSGETQWIQYGSNYSSRVAIPAIRTSTGTNPAGSTWTRNPIPACAGTGGGSKHAACTAPQFPPPIDGLYGFGLGTCTADEHGVPPCTREEEEHWGRLFNFNIVDEVKVPAGLSGDYVLSWRWDVEQTPQIWSGCADVTISSDPPADPCEVCNSGICSSCQACTLSKSGPCAACWQPNATTGQACLSDDKHDCQKCWSPPSNPCDVCNNGKCGLCKQCVDSKTGPCASCWAADAATGQACLYADGHGCQKCWSPTPPTPH